MEAGQKRIKLQLSGKLVYLVIQSILPYFAFCEKIKNPDSGNQDFTVFFSSRWWFNLTLGGLDYFRYANSSIFIVYN